MAKFKIPARLIVTLVVLLAVGLVFRQCEQSHLMTLIVGTPTIDLPFSVHKQGEVVEATLHVPRHEYYCFCMELYFKPGDTADRQRIMKLAGIGGTQDGKWVYDGIQIPVRLTIDKAAPSGPISIYRKEIYDEQTNGVSASFSKSIDSLWLDKGDYRIKVESLKDVPDWPMCRFVSLCMCQGI